MNTKSIIQGRSIGSTEVSLITEEDVKAMLSPLHAKIAQLEEMIARLQKNSSNSSKPPSSDIIKPKPKGRRKGERKIGAQPGHPKHERTL